MTMRSANIKNTSPSNKQLVLGYLTLCIPSAMLARVVRKVVGIKGTPMERGLMSYYCKMEKRLLK